MTMTLGTGLAATALLALASGALILAWDLRRRAVRLEALREAGKVHRSLKKPAALLRERRELNPQDSLYRIGRAQNEIDAVYPLHVVLSPLKTGCSTLAETIGSLELCSNLHSAHALSGVGALRTQRQAYKQEDPMRRERSLRHFRECCALRGVVYARRANVRALGLEDHPFARPWVVTSVREPVARIVSGIFFRGGHDLVASGRSRDDVLDTVRRQTLRQLHFTQSYQEWVDEELRNIFGFDPFGQPFPKERGWARGETARARVLQIRLESFSRLPDALGDFCGVPPETIRVEARNTARERPDYALYRETVRGLSLPRDELESVYASPGVTHFYTPEEIDGFLRRWTSAAQN